MNIINTLCVWCARSIEVDLEWYEVRAIDSLNDNCVTVSRLVVIDTGDNVVKATWDCPECEQKDSLRFENTAKETA